MAGRTIAIGDVHGCAAALATLLSALDLQPDDIVIVLGDYVDRGPDSKGVIDQLLAVSDRCTLVPLMGNHEEMFLDNLSHPHQPDAWLMYGGQATLDSYGPGTQLFDVPSEHVTFLRNCRNYLETETHFFVHANYTFDLPLRDQHVYTLRWMSLKQNVPQPHTSGKTAIVGHTAQRSGKILDLGHLKCIDTHCYGGGWLTALDVISGKVWQADMSGKLRAS